MLLERMVYMENNKPCCPILDIDGVISGGKQFDLDITLPEDNRDVIYGVVKNCFKEPVCDAVVKLVEVVKEMPLDRLLLETDSPYLSPEPYRGKENEPVRIIHIAEKIAQIKNTSLEKVLEITTNTAIAQFDLNR